MNNMDFLFQAMQALDQYMREQDFDPVPKRFDNFVQVVKFFAKLANEQGGVLDIKTILPHGIHGYIRVEFPKLVLRGKTYQNFAKIVNACSAFELVPKLDGMFEINMTFPRVFQIKK